MALDLGKQMGPLPLGAWIVVVAGGLGIAWYSTRNGGDEPTEPVEDTSGQPGVGDGSVGGWFPSQPGTGGSVTDPRDAVTDNDKWYAYISRELVARFNYDPVLVDSALRKYLAGGSGNLSVSEWVIIRAALAIMPPPNPIPAMPNDPAPKPNPVPVPIPKPAPKPVPVPRPVPVPKPPAPGIPKPPVPKPPPPKPKPAPPKPRVRTYTVRRGDNLWNISKRYYGTGIKWPTIYAANRKGKRRADGSYGMISNPNLIHPGWVLHIP